MKTALLTLAIILTTIAAGLTEEQMDAVFIAASQLEVD